MKEAIAIVHKPETCRFEAVIDGHIAYAAYTLNADIFTFAHTVVPAALGASGRGTAPASPAPPYAPPRPSRASPHTSFVKAYIDRHPDYQPLSLAQRQDG